MRELVNDESTFKGVKRLKCNINAINKTTHTYIYTFLRSDSNNMFNYVEYICLYTSLDLLCCMLLFVFVFVLLLYLCVSYWFVAPYTQAEIVVFLFDLGLFLFKFKIILVSSHYYFYFISSIEYVFVRFCSQVFYLRNWFLC